MKRSEGVRWFLTATLPIFFPEGEVCCRNCPLFVDRRDQKRGRCFHTNQLIFVPDAEGLPRGCPLTITGEIIGEKGEE